MTEFKLLGLGFIRRCILITSRTTKWKQVDEFYRDFIIFFPPTTKRVPHPRALAVNLGNDFHSSHLRDRRNLSLGPETCRRRGWRGSNRPALIIFSRRTCRRQHPFSGRSHAIRSHEYRPTRSRMTTISDRNLGLGLALVLKESVDKSRRPSAENGLNENISFQTLRGRSGFRRIRGGVRPPSVKLKTSVVFENIESKSFFYCHIDITY